MKTTLPSVFAEIVRQAEAENPRECCGMLLRSASGSGYEAVACRNVAEEPTEFFRVSSADYLAAVNTGRLAAYYHSHPRTSEKFSPADIAVSEAVLLPLYVYSLVTQQFALHEPKGHCLPLEGRFFVFGLHDCAGLVMDYHRQRLGVHLPEMSAEERTVKHLTDGFPQLDAYLERGGFVPVKSVSPNTVALMSLNGTGLVNHAAVLVDSSTILHQLMYRTSRLDLYGGYWQERTVKLVKHQSLL